MVLDEARERVVQHRESHPTDPDPIHLEAIAATAIKALRMWLGEIPVAEWPIERSN